MNEMRRKGRMQKWNKWPAWMGLALLCILLPGCSKGEKEKELPAEYAFGEEETLPALGADEKDEKGGLVCKVESDPDSEEESYVYTGLEAGNQTAQAYIEQMIEEHGCVLVDEKGKRQEEPDFTQESGQANLGRDAQDDAGMLLLRVMWSKDSCTVIPVLVEGAAVAAEKPDNLTVEEAVDRILAMKPQQLGLPGSSMEEYQLYAQEGYAMVDDTGCFCINVYDLDSAGSHRIKGSYLVRVDGTDIYRLDRYTNRVEPLPQAG